MKTWWKNKDSRGKVKEVNEGAGDKVEKTGKMSVKNSAMAGGSLFEARVDTFIELEDQLVQVGDIQGLFNLQITKLIFED